MAENREITVKTGRKRGPGRPFKPGENHNPGGRPKAVLPRAAFNDLWLREGEGFLRRLVELSKGKDKRTALAATRELLDRIVGRAREMVDLNVNDAEKQSAEFIAWMQQAHPGLIADFREHLRRKLEQEQAYNPALSEFGTW